MSKHYFPNGWETLVKTRKRQSTRSSSISKGKRLNRPPKKTNEMWIAAAKKREFLELLIESEDYLVTSGVRDCFPYGFYYPVPDKAAARQVAEEISYTRYCGNIHACPVCTPRAMARYREETILLMRDWKSRGGFFYLQTFTQRTDISAITTDLYKGLIQTWTAMRKSSNFSKSYKNAGAPEFIKVLEESLSKNGWNIHFHVIWFFPSSTTIHSAEGFLDVASTQWSHNANKWTVMGAEAHAQHWERVTDGTKKFAETMAWYMFKHGFFDVKETKAEVIAKEKWAPFDLLRVFLYTGEIPFGNAWLDFQVGCKGRNRVRFSKGLLVRLIEVDDQSQIEATA
jgi:hypothetical protein